MSHATEAARSGRCPCTFVEIDLDECTRYHPAGRTLDPAYHKDTIAAHDDQFLKQTEELDGTDWVAEGAISATIAAVDPPDGSNAVYLVADNDAGASAAIRQEVPAATVSDGVQHILSAKFREGTSTRPTLYIRDQTALAIRGYVQFTWVDHELQVSAAIVGAGSVVNLGGGYWLAVVLTNALTAANVHRVKLYPDDSAAPALGNVYATAMMLHAGVTPLEYQYEDARDGSRTNVRLATGGMDYDSLVGGRALINGTYYVIEDNGAGYIRVSGDATGEGIGDWVECAHMCTATTATPCYNTRATCEDTANYDGGGANVHTYRFCEGRMNVLPSAGAIPGVAAVATAPARITRARGIGPRERVTVTLTDHPHHDRGVDPYVSLRGFDPTTRSTFWAKLRARNPYYQGRPARVKTGYLTEPLDLANNFVTRAYVLERIMGPDSSGVVQIVLKDVLKLADDKRAQAPEPSEGVLAADIDAVAATLTLSPSGIGADYPASGTVRIGSEVMTYTGKAGDQLTGLGRGTDYTDADAHDAGETVQVCLRYDGWTIDDVVYDLLVTYAGIPAAYIDTAAWAADVDDYLAGHLATTLITEPTGVLTLIEEITEQYLCDIWWDSVAQKIRLQVLKPAFGAYDTLTAEANLAADSFNAVDDPEARLTEVWVYYGRFDPTEKMDDPRNYATRYIRADVDAEGTTQFGDVRVKKIWSRWITQSGDALRLGARLLNATRDTPRTYTFDLDAKDDYDLGDVVALSTDELIDVHGARVATRVYILERTEPVPGHKIAVRATDDAFKERYARIGPDAMNDYDAATDAEKRDYGYIAENSAPQLNGDGPYRVV